MTEGFLLRIKNNTDRDFDNGCLALFPIAMLPDKPFRFIDYDVIYYLDHRFNKVSYPNTAAYAIVDIPKLLAFDEFVLVAEYTQYWLPNLQTYTFKGYPYISYSGTRYLYENFAFVGVCRQFGDQRSIGVDINTTYQQYSYSFYHDRIDVSVGSLSETFVLDPYQLNFLFPLNSEVLFYTPYQYLLCPRYPYENIPVSLSMSYKYDFNKPVLVDPVVKVKVESTHPINSYLQYKLPSKKAAPYTTINFAIQNRYYRYETLPVFYLRPFCLGDFIEMFAETNFAEFRPLRDDEWDRYSAIWFMLPNYVTAENIPVYNCSEYKNYSAEIVFNGFYKVNAPVGTKLTNSSYSNTAASLIKFYLLPVSHEIEVNFGYLYKIKRISATQIEIWDYQDNLIATIDCGIYDKLTLMAVKYQGIFYRINNQPAIQLTSANYNPTYLEYVSTTFEGFTLLVMWIVPVGVYDWNNYLLNKEW